MDAQTNKELLNLKNICRLCAGRKELVWVFDKKFDFPQNMRDIIMTTTSVKISETDAVTQRICTKCVAIAIKMFQFRDQSIRNDKFLKEKYDQLTKNSKLKSSNEISTIDDKSLPKAITEDKTIKDKPTDDNKQEISKPKPNYKAHPSITALFKVYPKIRLPAICLRYNMNPTVTMEMDEVENYFKIRKLDIQKYIHLALKKPNNVAKKRTSGIARPLKSLTIPKMFSSIRLKQTNVLPTEADIPQKDSLINPFANNLLKKSEESGRSSPFSNSLSEESDQNSIVSYPNRQTRSTGGVTIRNDEVLAFRRKRKLSTDSSSSQQSIKKPLLVDVTNSPLSTSPAASPFSNISDLSFKVSREMHVCNICCSVYAQASSLKRHQFNHLRCQFCKEKFRSLAIKEKHVETQCKVSKIMKSMINLPDIPLQKIETNVKIRRKFYKAFDAYDLISETELNCLLKKNIEVSIKGDPNIIEIKSDDETPPAKVDIVTNHRSEKLIPDIKISDNAFNSLLYENVSDIKLIKSYLLQYNKLHRKVNDSTQTFLPTNELIKVNHTDLSNEMRSLKQHLFYYKIPIEIKCGTGFNVCYRYDSGLKKARKLHYWDDIIPADIKLPRTETIKPENNLDVSSEVKQEIITTNDEDHEKPEEILVEEIYNRSIPLLPHVQQQVHSTDTSSTEDTIQLFLSDTEDNSTNEKSSKNIPNLFISDDEISLDSNDEQDSLIQMTVKKVIEDKECDKDNEGEITDIQKDLNNENCNSESRDENMETDCNNDNEDEITNNEKDLTNDISTSSERVIDNDNEMDLEQESHSEGHKTIDNNENSRLEIQNTCKDIEMPVNNYDEGNIDNNMDKHVDDEHGNKKKVSECDNQLEITKEVITGDSTDNNIKEDREDNETSCINDDDEIEISLPITREIAGDNIEESSEDNLEEGCKANETNNINNEDDQDLITEENSQPNASDNIEETSKDIENKLTNTVEDKQNRDADKDTQVDPNHGVTDNNIEIAVEDNENQITNSTAEDKQNLETDEDALSETSEQVATNLTESNTKTDVTNGLSDTDETSNQGENENTIKTSNQLNKSSTVKKLTEQEQQLHIAAIDAKSINGDIDDEDVAENVNQPVIRVKTVSELNT